MSKQNDFIDKMIDYENGTLDEDQTVEMFQNLIDSKIIYSLQGSYQRTAQSLIETGHCYKD